jgi:hypothetical protein
MPGDMQNNTHRGVEHPKESPFLNDIFKLTYRKGRRRNETMVLRATTPLSFLRWDSLSYQAKQPQHLTEELMHLDVGAFRFLRPLSQPDYSVVFNSTAVRLET